MKEKRLKNNTNDENKHVEISFEFHFEIRHGSLLYPSAPQPSRWRSLPGLPTRSAPYASKGCMHPSTVGRWLPAAPSPTLPPIPRAVLAPFATWTTARFIWQKRGGGPFVPTAMVGAGPRSPLAARSCCDGGSWGIRLARSNSMSMRPFFACIAFLKHGQGLLIFLHHVSTIPTAGTCMGPTALQELGMQVVITRVCS